jgi:tetratricopeptide (TPR) repeat protein
VDDALARDDGDALAAALAPRRDEGKALLAAWEREIAGTADPAEREALGRRISALVAVYAKAFGDPEPLERLRRQASPEQQAAVRMQEAQTAFRAGDLEMADRQAADGLRALEPVDVTGEALALESSLLSLRGGVAARTERWDEAADLFGRALDRARESGHADARAAGVINLLDLHTRRGTFVEAAPLLDEAVEAVAGGQFEDVLGRLLVERGVGQTGSADLPGAIETFDRAIALKPDWPFPWYQRGWARFLSGDPGGALDDYRECASRKGVFFTVQREIRCLEDVAAGRIPIETYRTFCAIRDRVRQQPDEVEAGARRMTERWPDFAPAWLLLAETYLVRGDGESAREAAAESMRRDPDADTAAAALFVEWNVAKREGDAMARREAEERLDRAYGESAAAHLVRRIRELGDRDVALRWTFSLDGSLQLEEVNPPDRTTPPPGSPG